jgi:sulfur carrier protein ThiS adenylyltransferase
MPESTVTSPDRDQRQLVPPDRLARCDVLVIGVGAIGRQVALQLAALGAPRLTLFDDDIVQPENLAPQGYWPDDLNRQKVEATAALCRRIYPAILVNPVAQRFKRSTLRERNLENEPIVFCCVDSITTRRLIWETCRALASLFIDGRMSAEVVRVLAVNEHLSDRHYEQTLFAAEEAFAGSCTARSTIYTASIAAGLMVQQFTKWLRQLPVDADFTLNLLATELTAPGA